MNKVIQEKYTENDLPEFVNYIPIGWKKYRVCFLLKAGHQGLKIGPFGSQLKVEEMIPKGFKVYGQENVIAHDFKKGVRYISQEKFNELKVYQIQPGDILITMMGSSGRCQIVTDDIESGIMDSHLVRLRVLDTFIYPQFFQILIEQSEYLKYQIKILGKGSIMHGLNSTIIKNLLVLLPPLIVQNTILQFLDHKTALIDQYIVNKQRQLELLEKLRTSIISEAVTLGLNPDVEMKDSGVEWLGKIPVHWQLKKIKYLGRFQGGGTPSKDNVSFWKGSIPWVSPKDMGSQVILDTEDKITEEAIRKSATKLIKAGAIVLVMRSGILRRAIPVAMLSIDATLNQDMKAIISNEEMLPEYLLYLIHGNQFKLLSEWVKEGSTVESIEYKLFADTKCPVPPKDEQQRIIDFIKIELNRVDKLVDQLTQQITKMEAYRTSLISEAVTGKIDVRDFKLPVTQTSSAIATQAPLGV